MASRVPVASQFAVYGPTFLDVVMGPLDGPPVPGREAWVEGALMCAGGAANQAIALARLGVPVRLHSRVGVDQMGAFVDEMLAREGVDTSSCERVGDQNVTVSLSFDGDRAMTTRGTTALSRLGGDAPACLLADVRGISGNTEIVSSWRERGTWVLADTAWDEAGAWDPADLEALRVADVCTPNEEEALAYARTDNVEEAARWFASFGCDCVVTCGKNGVVACVDGQILRLVQRQQVPAHLHFIQQTGAGDVFSAALAWARRARRMPWPEALALACAAAAHSTQGIGGSASAPYAADLPGA